MIRFKEVFKKKCNIIGMIHLDALPGTPKYSGNFDKILDKALYETDLYTKHKMDAILIENMNDIPYTQNIGSEIISSMTKIATELKKIIPKEMSCGIQVLACGNKEAIAIAKACNLQFIRCEGFVFSHIADEGFTNACAGDLLRYRKQIDADNILIFTDIKKKHSSHSITADTSLLETTKAAEFFLSDGIILTGTSTGIAANPNDLNQIYSKIKLPILIGSGITKDNVKNYYDKSDGLIIGSYFKKLNYWENDICTNSINDFMEVIQELRNDEKTFK